MIVSMILSLASSILLAGAYHFAYLDNFLGKGSNFLLGLLLCLILDLTGRKRSAQIILSIVLLLGILYSIGQIGWSRSGGDCYAHTYYVMHTFASDIVFWLAVFVSFMVFGEAFLLGRHTKRKEQR